MITAATNPKVKNLINLIKKGKTRREQDVFVAEGIKMFLEAEEKQVKEVYLSQRFFSSLKKGEELQEKLSRCKVEILADALFDRVADTQSPQGIMGVIWQNHYEKEELLQRENPLLLLLEDIQDPGNLGTMIRTAEGAGADGVVMSGSTVDIYNPKTIRSTMGSIYRVPFFYTEDMGEMIAWLQEKSVAVYGAYLQGGCDYDQLNFKQGCALLIGNEGRGLKAETAHTATGLMKIPMKGKVESLNAAAAASILLYEAARQRR